jgi:hypothetical protein
MSLPQTHCLSSELSIVVSFSQLEQESSIVDRFGKLTASMMFRNMTEIGHLGEKIKT